MQEKEKQMKLSNFFISSRLIVNFLFLFVSLSPQSSFASIYHRWSCSPRRETKHGDKVLSSSPFSPRSREDENGDTILSYPPCGSKNDDDGTSPMETGCRRRQNPIRQYTGSSSCKYGVIFAFRIYLCNCFCYNWWFSLHSKFWLQPKTFKVFVKKEKKHFKSFQECRKAGIILFFTFSSL